MPTSRKSSFSPARRRVSPDDGPMKTLAGLTDRLQALHARTAETPLFNPVFQLSLELSRLIERGLSRTTR